MTGVSMSKSLRVKASLDQKQRDHVVGLNVSA